MIRTIALSVCGLLLASLPADAGLLRNRTNVNVNVNTAGAGVAQVQQLQVQQLQQANIRASIRTGGLLQRNRVNVNINAGAPVVGTATVVSSVPPQSLTINQIRVDPNHRGLLNQLNQFNYTPTNSAANIQFRLQTQTRAPLVTQYGYTLPAQSAPLLQQQLNVDPGCPACQGAAAAQPGVSSVPAQLQQIQGGVATPNYYTQPAQAPLLQQQLNVDPGCYAQPAQQLRQPVLPVQQDPALIVTRRPLFITNRYAYYHHGYGLHANLRFRGGFHRGPRGNFHFHH